MFGDFNGGYCIQNSSDDCIIYTNQAGTIYIPEDYTNLLVGEYGFDDTNEETIFTIKEETGVPIVTITVKIQK
jgi:hypothetical protein